MDVTAKAHIKELIKTKINSKLNKYKSETDRKPFFEALFDRSVIIQASIMQSLYTSFGMSIYEQIAVILANTYGYHAERQYALTGSIDPLTEALILEICTRDEPDKLSEIEEIRNCVQPDNHLSQDPERVVDVYLEKADNQEVYIDITTVKPNLKEFRTLRRKLLRWCALRFSTDRNANVSTYIGLPYNPYDPEPYERWTANELDHQYDLLVQEDLWKEFTGVDVYSDLLSAFQEVGLEMKERIDQFLS